jgi:hypothetical protein
MGISDTARTAWETIKAGVTGGPSTCQPAAILRRIEKQAYRHKKVFARKVYVPDTFHVSLSAQDLESLTPILPILEQEITAELKKAFAGHGFATNVPDITLTFTGKQILAPGDMDVECRFSEPGRTPGPTAEPTPARIPARAGGREFGSDRLDDSAGSDSTSHSGGAHARVMITLIYREKKSDPVHLKDGKYLVGRGKDADIVTDRHDTLVSKHHCLLEINGPSVHVTDLSSRNGTLVSGRPVTRRTRMPLPGTIDIGNTRIEVRG